MRHAHRMHDDRSERSKTSFIVREVDADLMERLRETGRSYRAGLNDIFLAAMATAIAKATPARRVHRRRQKIALGTVFSPRRWMPKDLAGFFGVLLGDATVLIHNPDAEMSEILPCVVRQTRRLKTRSGALEPSWRFFFVKYLWPMMRVPATEASYRKVFPLCSGVSGSALDKSHFGDAMGHIRRYIRASPPGPAMPMVLSPGMATDRLDLSLVFRPSYLSNADADALLDLFVGALEGFAA